MHETLEYQGRQVELVRRSGQRRLRLQVRPNGTIRLSCGRRVPKKELLRFLNDTRGFIQKALDEYAHLKSQFPMKRFEAGEAFLFLGRPRQLNLVPAPKTRVLLLGEKIILQNPPDDVRERQVAMIEFYKRCGRAYLANRIEYWSRKMGLVPAKVSYRSQKTRWGSCSSRGQISLNWRLVLAPYEVCDYVVIHELAHLRHPNHSSRFWTLVASYCPDYAKWKQWLYSNQPEFEFLDPTSEWHSL